MNQTQINFIKSELIESTGQTKKNCLKVLPNKIPNKIQKFIIGNDKGRVILYNPHHGFIQSEDKNIYLGEPINCIELSGIKKNFRDRMYITGH